MSTAPRTDLRCGDCDRPLVFARGSWRHTDDLSLLCHFAVPYVDGEKHEAEKGWEL